jgi:hypothetical protein
MTSSSSTASLDWQAGHHENPWMFFSHLEELFHVLDENYASYRIKPDRPAQQSQGGYSKDALTKHFNDFVKAYSKFLLTQVFHAAAPENVRCLISHKNQTRLMGDDAYQVFFTEHKVETHKKAAAINVVSEEQNSADTDPEITAFHLQQKQQAHSGQQNFSQQGSGNKFNHNRAQNNTCGKKFQQQIKQRWF